MPLFNDKFLESVVSDFHALNSSSARAGVKAIVDGFETHLPGSDLRWLAYMLATAFHETAATMQPVREAFWLSDKWRKKNLPYYPYYGRGYVQLTHEGNYKRAGDDIGVDLVGSPDLALDPANAAHVMFVGMTEGWFRADAKGRHTLQRYFSGALADPVGARNIINGKETKVIDGKTVTIAEVIAGYYDDFLAALEAGGGNVAPGTVNAAPAVPPAGTPSSSRFDEERAVLLDLAGPFGLNEAIEKALALREKLYPASHPRYWAVVNFAQRSDEPRLYIFDIELKSTSSYLCAHGKGSDPGNTGYATLFSNIDGSNMSSLGVYRCAETYFGVHGYSMRLDGLEDTNSNARHRAIVIHPADYVSDAFASENHRVGRSLGCPAVDAAHSEEIINRLKLGSFLVGWSDG